MKKIIFCLLICFHLSSLFAQINTEQVEKKIDSLREILNTETNDTIRIKTMHALGAYIYQSNPNEVLKHLNETVSISKQKLQGKLTIKEKNFYHGYYVRSLTNLGLVYGALNQYQKAIDISFEALQLHLADSNLMRVATTHLSIGILYGEMEHNELALKYFDKVINSTIVKEQDPTLIADALQNKGVVLTYQQRYDEALIAFNRSIAIFEKANLKNFSSSYLELARIHLKFNRLDSANYYNDKAFELITKYDSPEQEVTYHELKARILFKSKNYEKALLAANLALDLALASNDLLRQQSIRKLLYDTYNKMGNDKNSLEQLDSFYAIKDSLEQLQEKDLAIKRDLRYEYEMSAIADSINREKKNALIEKKLQQSFELEQSRAYLAYGSFALILILSLLSGVAYKQKRANNKTLVTKNELIEQTIKDKELFMKEIHHRVKNNMQMVSSVLQLKSSESENPEVKKELLDSQSRILSMSLAHKNLYENNNYETINLAIYIKEIVKSVLDSNQNSYTDHFSFNSDDHFINVEQAQAVGFIMHELALNCVKYAWERDSIKNLAVSITEKDQRLFISCIDNGRGLPDNFDIETVPSMGLKLVRSFTKRQLKGEIVFRSNKGTAVELSFVPRT